jgi:phosphoribosylanthranilate isomerase
MTGIAVKICGVNSREAAEAAAAAGAAYIGLVFYPPSPRHVARAEAAALARALPAGVRRVGLFVDADDATLEAALDAVPLDLVQLHGGEPPERVSALKARFGLPALPGGNALRFDWRLVAGHSWPLPWMLSGGLTAENLAEAVRTSGARVVDVSSGVEDRPGHKDPARIKAFLAAARAL